MEITLPQIPSSQGRADSTETYEQKDIDVSIPIEEKKSADFQFLAEVYNATMGIKAVDQQLALWMNALEQGATREGVYRGIVLDETYRKLESKSAPPTEAAVAFATSLLETYANITANMEVLRKLNNHTLKKYCTEKALEVMDLLRARPEDLLNWYALFSADMAKRFGNLWSNGPRANTNPAFHKEWAKTVPTQYLKSEVIIKLHESFNSL